MKFLIRATTENIEDYSLFLQKYKFEFSEEDSSEGHVTIESLEELLDLQKNIDYSLIIRGGAIEIYDDYRE